MSQKTATKPLEIVPGQSHLYRRGGRYYFRMVVPEPLRRIVGKRELVESLKTSNFAEAKRLLPARMLSAQTILEVAKLRAAAKSELRHGIRRSEVMFPEPLPNDLPERFNVTPQIAFLSRKEKRERQRKRCFNIRLQRGCRLSCSERIGPPNR